MDESNAVQYWKANITLISILLAIWAFVSFGCGILFAPFLNQFMIGSLPLGFWFAQQGAMVVFVILIFVYCVRMDKIDNKFDVQE